MNRGRFVSFSKGKAKNKQYTLKRLWDYLFKFRLLLIIALLLTIISNLLQLLGPKLTGLIMDEIDLGAGNINFQNVYYIAVLMAIFYFVSNVFSFLISILMINISKRCVYTMRKDAFNKMLQLPISYFDKNQIGDIISRMSYDIENFEENTRVELAENWRTIFKENLDDIVDKLLDINEPIRQTKESKHCKYCPFIPICGKEVKD